MLTQLKPLQKFHFPEPLKTLEACQKKPDPLCILVIEDEPRMRHSLCELLRKNSFEVHEAAHGREAIEKLRKHHYHLALVDLNLPQLSGHEVMEFVRCNQLKTRLIVVSGEKDFSAATQAIRNGAIDFISKPFDFSTLLGVINKVSERVELRLRAQCIQEQIKCSEELHRFMVNNSPDLIYMLDHKGCFTFVNNRAENLLGREMDELLGEHYSKVVFEEDLERANHAFNERRTGKRASRGIELRLKNNHQDSPVHVEARCTPVELTSMGVYTVEHSGTDLFVGTYGVIRDLTERKRAEELIRYHLYHDTLTALPNRTLFNDRLQMALIQARREKLKLAVIFIDLDHFKKVNDTFGHLVGDEILQTVAKNLKGCLREGDTLARIGGDEFLLLATNLHDDRDAAKICRKMLEKFSTPLVFQGREIRVTISMGIAIYPDHGETQQALVRYADLAMYRSKEQGRNSYHFYTNAMPQKDTHSLELESDLYHAIERGELELHYQPQVDLSSERVVGLEALLRWKHPSRGAIPPSLFIPLAEQSHLISDLGAWVFQRACEDAVSLEKMGLNYLKIAINVSIYQLEKEGFFADCQKVLNSCNLQHNCIEVEITESGLMKDMQKVSSVLREFENHGISVAIDDFGTGYSSLNYLQSLPINTLKIDGSFIQNENLKEGDKTIFSAILSMAQGLRVDCIVEGVETMEQKRYLKLAGCTTAQGFLFSSPLPLEKVKKYIQDQASTPHS